MITHSGPVSCSLREYDDAAGVIGVVEFDDVVARHMRRTRELFTQCLVEPAPQRHPSLGVATHPYIRGKEIHQRIERPHIEREAIARDQLADRVE